ncbi:hypothetical protein U876_11190 [Aeromonas hydrophila NJ-35]|nr:hypothetical protein V428_12280 [Aeromonas hydrophila subsp. hydrophila AL09-71]AHX69634.1 hypothetical protein V429_12295 [Aeromonas hydrophila pc104A]AJE38625.1 hypothetical protein V469_10780 [Aeromonas hydrophila J-1]AKJ37053.1 hypothetical protein U876_11190 [Aeromonas hydrophila NJ-35]ALQ63400.1 hypothetical protein AS145_11105 [Aeromonas hydrophila]
MLTLVFMTLCIVVMVMTVFKDLYFAFIAKTVIAQSVTFFKKSYAKVMVAKVAKTHLPKEQL